MSRNRIARILTRFRAPLIALAFLVLAIAALDVLVDEPLRRRVEQRMNERLEGYSVSLAALDFTPWNLSLELRELYLVQEAYPTPPVAHFPRIDFSVHWRSLLAGRVVADAVFEAPRLHVDLRQLREERTDEVEIDDRGWQDALLAAYPLKINELEVADGSLVYAHNDSEHPLELSEVELSASNIRNVRSPEDVYPSRVRADAQVFDRGRASVSGAADFLAEPHARVRADLELETVPLEQLDPLGRDVQLVIRGGELSAEGEVEYTAERRSLHLAEVLIDGLRIDYLFDPELTERALEAAERIEQEPTFAYRLDRLQVVDGELGFVDRRREPGYRIFLAGLDGHLTDLASRSSEPSEVRLEGRFMGSGETVAYGVFRTDRDAADFDVGVAIRGTELERMNDLLRTYAKLDVRDGTFSLYSELEVVDGEIDGYIKPLFEDVDAYDSAQDRHDNLFQRIWERIVEGLSELLANRPRDELATIATFEGSVEDPDASTLQIVARLIRNAFFDAILPGFEQRYGQDRRASAGGPERGPRPAAAPAAARAGR